MTVQNRQNLLMHYARQHCIKDRIESQGLCFHATILLAKRADALGLSENVRFVRWRVKRDPNFREHWAISFAENHVLDMTAAQIGGDPEPCRPIAIYPATYTSRREYPLHVILGPEASATLEDYDRYSRVSLWHIHLSMVHHDLNAAIKQFAPWELAKASGRFVEVCGVFVADYLLDRAAKRLTRLLHKLR